MRKPEHEEHTDETWLIPYADLLTLLLALFIVLFATSSVDQELMSAMQEAFYQEYNGIMPEPKVGEPGQGGDYAGTSMIPGEAEPTAPPSESGEGGEDENDPITALQDAFASYVELNGLEAEMRIETREDGLLLTLTSDIWFASGSADINGPQREIAAEISKMIAKVQDDSKVKLSVIVSGHTDNVPLSARSEYHSNWRLSVVRAVNFMEELLNTSTLQPSNFSARGFGEYEPIDTNDTAEGRQHNRRVEVLISPETPEGGAAGEAPAAESDGAEAPAAAPEAQPAVAEE